MNDLSHTDFEERGRRMIKDALTGLSANEAIHMLRNLATWILFEIEQLEIVATDEDRQRRVLR
jgi:hypothetical protein